MRLLALDTSTLTLSAALVEITTGSALRVLGERDESGRGRHSVLLPGVLLDLLREAGMELRECDGLAAGLGPGSFTGLRTGLATLKSLAYAAGLPLGGVSSLLAMAEAAATSLPPQHDTLLVPCLDARRGEVYAGFYGVGEGGVVVSRRPEAALSPEELLAQLEDHSGSVVFFGEGVDRFESLRTRALEAPKLPRTPPARAVATRVAPDLRAYDKAAVLALVPRYLRRSEAEIKREQGTLNIPGLTGPAGRGAGDSPIG